MLGRVEFDGKYTFKSTDWDKLVNAPARERYFIEAFASADAILDEMLRSILVNF